MIIYFENCTYLIFTKIAIACSRKPLIFTLEKLIWFYTLKHKINS